MKPRTIKPTPNVHRTSSARPGHPCAAWAALPRSKLLTTSGPAAARRYDRCFEFYKQAQASYWTAEEVDLSQDMRDWRKLTDDERHFISYVSPAPRPRRPTPPQVQVLQFWPPRCQGCPFLPHLLLPVVRALSLAHLAASQPLSVPLLPAGAGLLRRL